MRPNKPVRIASDGGETISRRRGSPGMLLRLAFADLWHERMLTLCVTVALTAVLAPLLILFSLKYGLVETLRTRLVNDPRNREIRPELGHGFTVADVGELSRLPGISFVMPNTRSISSSVKIGKSAGGDMVHADLVPSGPGDPLLEENDVPFPTEGTCILSHHAWRELAPSQEIVPIVHVMVSRQGEGQKLEQVSVPLTVSGIAPQRATELSAVFTTLDFLEKVESWREGNEIRSFGWPGGNARVSGVTDQVIIVMPRALDPAEQSSLPLKAPWISEIAEIPKPEGIADMPPPQSASHFYLAATSSKRRDNAADDRAILALRRSLPVDAGNIYAHCRPLNLRLHRADGSEIESLTFQVRPLLVNPKKSFRAPETREGRPPEPAVLVKPDPAKIKEIENSTPGKPVPPDEATVKTPPANPSKPFNPRIKLPPEALQQKPIPKKAIPVDEGSYQKAVRKPASSTPSRSRRKEGDQKSAPENVPKKDRVQPGAGIRVPQNGFFLVSLNLEDRTEADPAATAPSSPPVGPGPVAVGNPAPQVEGMLPGASPDSQEPRDATTGRQDSLLPALPPPVEPAEPALEVLLPTGMGAVEGQTLQATYETPFGPIVFPVSVRLHQGPDPMVSQSLAGVLRAGLDRSIDFDPQTARFVPSRKGYPSLRIVARTIDDVAVIQDYFKSRQIGVTTAAARIRDVKELDRYTNYVFLLIAGVGLTGAAGSLLASLIAAVERKRRSFGVLRLLGLRRRTIFRMPVYQSTIVVSLAYGIAVIAWYYVSSIILKVTAASDYLDGESVQTLPLSYLWIFWGGALAVGLAASAFAGLRVMRVEPGEAIRDE